MIEPLSKAGATSNEPDPAVCPPGRLPAEFVAAAERIQRTFLNEFAGDLSAALERTVVASLVSVEQESFEAFAEKHNSAGCIIALDLAPLSGCALLSLSRPLVFKVLDIFMATPETAASTGRETLTAIELHVLEELFGLFARVLRSTWEPLYPVAFDVIAVGPENIAEPAAIQAAQTAVVLRSHVQIDEETGDFEMAVPGFLFRMAESRSHKTSAALEAPADIDENLLSALGGVRVEIESVLNGARVPVGELLRIRPGQILSLGTPADSLFECLVNGKPRFEGEMVANGGRAAFRVEAIRTRQMVEQIEP